MTAATTLNPEATSGISIGYSIGSLAERLRRITVCIRGARDTGTRDTGTRDTGTRGARGSGVIWRDGLIVTNAHVAISKTHAVDFPVDFFGGRTVQGKLVARDPGLDLAAIAVDVVGLPAAAVRSARELRAGEMLVAVGNPWDGEGAVSAGILHRAAGAGPVIFADIRLAPGNSGGPLADAQGNVVGINSAIFRGLGCAVTSDAVKEFLHGAGLLEAA